MAEQIKFAGDQSSNLLIEVSGYERPLATDEDDANWLTSAVTIKAGPFAGAFKADFTTHDLTILHERLQSALASLSGTISFENTGGDIAFDIEFNKRGGATISGTAHPTRSLEASLAFRFDTDQSYLAQTLRELGAALRKFPVKRR